VDDLLVAFSQMAEVYRRAAEVRDLPGGLKALRSKAAREGACEVVHAARSWMVWARGQTDEQASAIAASMVFMAEAAFIATREHAAEGPLPPDREFLTALIAASGAAEWAFDHGHEIPDWLT
jgi:hypothetical protein